MNLTIAAGRYLCAAEAEPATDVHPLGKPINRPQDQPKPAPVERWVPATVKGYERSTTTGAIRQKAFMAAPGLYLESGEFIPAEQINAQPADSGEVLSEDDVYDARQDAYVRLQLACGAPAMTAWGMTKQVLRDHGADGESPQSADIPADRRAEVIAALQAL